MSVRVVGNEAIADISLQNAKGLYTAEVTITFDTPVNLTANELNITAQLINPTDSALLARMGCITLLLRCPVTIDPAFPVMITVEPLTQRAGGNLSFKNAYQFELHTSNLECTALYTGASCPTTPYRLFKAPINGAFSDISTDVLKGSIRARGTSGHFSQFLIIRDARLPLVVFLQKYTALLAAILESSISNLLRNELVGLLNGVSSAVLSGNLSLAISQLDQLTHVIEAEAGVTISNVWNSNHLLVNDAGDLESLTNTLRYTLARMQNGG